MAISDKLKKIYSGNSDVERYYDTIHISHPNFTQDFFFVMDDISHDWEDSTSTLQTFEPLGFSVILPKQGDAQQDIMLVLDNTNMQLIEELNNASLDIQTPISFVLGVYIDSEVAAQNDFYTLKLKNITLTQRAISATASADDLINIDFPKSFFDERFLGLFL